MGEHAAALTRFASGFASDPADCEDLFQDICLAIWRALPRFRGECSEKTFLFRIAQNRGLTHRHKDNRVGIGDIDPDSLPDPRSDTEHAQTSRELHEILVRAIHALPEQYRGTVLMTLEGFSHRDIADVVGISENNVAVRLTRARQRLRRLLEPKGLT